MSGVTLSQGAWDCPESKVDRVPQAKDVHGAEQINFGIKTHMPNGMGWVPP